ncbi:MAG: DnaJ domain-containing protein [Parvimonas sp.]|nr:DnaJ domain-containing protein [Parvimonas sp.]
MKKLFGKFILGLSKVLDVILGAIVTGLSYIVNLLSSISVFLVLIGIAFLTLGSFLLPLVLIFLLSNPVFWLIIFVFFIVPFLGKKFISFLRYINYSLCEYLNDYGNFLLGNNKGYSSFKEYKRKYERAQEEQYEREREERQRREQEEWERRFNAFNEYFSNQGGYYGGYQGYQGYYQNAGASYDPYSDFKNKFENACRVLEFNTFDIDYYQVKLQYRKLAKKYHPDLNRDTDTTEKFQEINSAFEFLTEENIKRYNQMKR